jgi:hypothetical protein
VRLALVLLVLTGCDQVWGLERGPADASGAARVVSGRIVRRFMSNDASLQPVVETVPYMNADAPTVTFHGEDIPVGWSAVEGIFTFTVPGQTAYQLMFDGAEYQLTADTVALDTIIPGHANAQDPDPATVLKLLSTPPLVDQANVYVITTGVFSVTKPVTVTSGEYQMSWAAAGFRGQPGRLDAAANDRGWLVQFENVAGGYERMTQVMPFTTTLAMPGEHTVSGTPSALAPASCATIDAPLVAEAARLVAMHPGFVAGARSWSMFTAPRPEYGLSALFTLVLSGPTLAAEVHYGNPFAGHSTLLAYATSAQSPSPTGGSATTYSFDLIADSATCAPHVLPIGVTVPQRPVFARVPLVDDVTVGIAAGDPLELTWDDSAGALPSTGYDVRLIDASRTKPVVLRSIYTAERRAVIDPALLENGVTYRFSIVGTTHQPDRVTGDFTKRIYPYAMAELVTGTFTVSR